MSNLESINVKRNKLSNKIATNTKIVFDELLSNIINYGFEDVKQHTIHIETKMNGNNLIIIIEDDGISFNPFQLKTPDITLSIEKRKIGGLGVHLVKNLVDEYHYLRGTNKNTSTMITYNVT